MGMGALLVRLYTEPLVDLVRALSEDDRLSEWFLNMETLPLPSRATELGGMATQMQAAGEDAALVNALTLLARPTLFAAACEALRELRR